MLKPKRKPKQDFKINHANIIANKDLNIQEKIILQFILLYHQEHNKYDFNFILNSTFIEKLGINKATFMKYRDSLEHKKIIKIKIKQHGKTIEVEKIKRKNNPLYYYPQWTNLSNLNFISNIEKNDFQKKFKEKVEKVKSTKTSFIKKGVEITADLAEKLNDDKYYPIKINTFNEKGEINKGNAIKLSGKQIKGNLTSQKWMSDEKGYKINEFIFN